MGEDLGSTTPLEVVVDFLEYMFLLLLFALRTISSTLLVLPRKFHGQRSLVGYKELDITEYSTAQQLELDNSCVIPGGY